MSECKTHAGYVTSSIYWLSDSVRLQYHQLISVNERRQLRTGLFGTLRVPVIL